MAIYVTGDTHGPDSYGYGSVDGYVSRLNTNNFPDQKRLTKDDYVIICGDFGGIWDTDKRDFKESLYEKHNLDWLNDKPFTTLFIPGNHENYDRLTGINDERLLNCWLFEKMPEEAKQRFREGYPRKLWHGSYVREIRPSVLMLEPGVFDIDGCMCFAYGGAASHDISGGIIDPADYTNESEYKMALRMTSEKFLPFRVKGISWWKQEEPDQTAEKAAFEALEKVSWNVDYVFTHDCPWSERVYLGYTERCTRINEFLDTVKDRLEYKHWFFGHLHDNIDLPGGKDHLIYEQMIRIL